MPSISNNLEPVNYQIFLEPDLKSFSFTGKVEILLKALEPVHELVMNVLDLTIQSCSVKEANHLTDCSFVINPDDEAIKIVLPKRRSGEITLIIRYNGPINDMMAGLYRTQYRRDGETRYAAVTQFEESDARRAFPCIDHPVKKATFNIEMIIDDNLTAISNSPITKEQPWDEGKKRVSFHQTPKMSTYLLFFGVGEFDFIEDSNDSRIRAAVMPGMKDYAVFGTEFGRKSLEYCEDFYGIKYPLQKLDLIAIPDFAFGAMENWGAITFRENLLLHFPDITSKAGEERICEVIAHEIVHQWFGNLVTPTDWKYLWLNESFATYFGYGIVSHFNPEWDVWNQFLLDVTHTALHRDSLLNTIPIEIPGGEHVVINTATAPIIYNKGGSVLRQVKEYIGDDAFKEGLRQYLNKYAYACASSHHLWESFEEVSEKPVTEMMKSWVEQKGYPMVTVKKEGDELVFTQKRFTYLLNDSKQKWLLPVTVRKFYKDGGSETQTLLLKEKQGTINIGGNTVTYKVNDRQTGFYRVAYDDRENLDSLGTLISSKDLATEDRWGLQNDLYAMVRSGNASIENYLAFLNNYFVEDAFLPLSGITDNLYHAYLVLGDVEKEKIALAGKAFTEKALSDIGYDPGPAEKHTTSILRDKLIWPAAVFASKDAIAFAREKFSLLMDGQIIHQDIMKSVMQVSALNGDDTVLNWLDERFHSTKSEHERMNILIALGCFKKKALIEKTQQYVLNRVPSRNKYLPITMLAANPHAIPYMWDWYISHVKILEQFHPLHYERVIASIIPTCGLGKLEEVKTFFEAYVSRKKVNQEVVDLALEHLEINTRMRAHN